GCSQPRMTAELARRVVKPGPFPAWEYHPQGRTYHYFHPPVQRPVTDYLAMQGRFGHMLPEHVATMQVGANRNWEAIGMDVPQALRDLEDPARHQRLKDEEYSMPINRGVGAGRMALFPGGATAPPAPPGWQIVVDGGHPQRTL